MFCRSKQFRMKLLKYSGMTMFLKYPPNPLKIAFFAPFSSPAQKVYNIYFLFISLFFPLICFFAVTINIMNHLNRKFSIRALKKNHSYFYELYKIYANYGELLNV